MYCFEKKKEQKGKEGGEGNQPTVKKDPCLAKKEEGKPGKMRRSSVDQ